MRLARNDRVRVINHITPKPPRSYIYKQGMATRTHTQTITRAHTRTEREMKIFSRTMRSKGKEASTDEAPPTQPVTRSCSVSMKRLSHQSIMAEHSTNHTEPLYAVVDQSSSCPAPAPRASPPPPPRAKVTSGSASSEEGDQEEKTTVYDNFFSSPAREDIYATPQQPKQNAEDLYALPQDMIVPSRRPASPQLLPIHTRAMVLCMPPLDLSIPDTPPPALPPKTVKIQYIKEKKKPKTPEPYAAHRARSLVIA